MLLPRGGIPSHRIMSHWRFPGLVGGRNSATISLLILVQNISPDIIPYSSNSQSHSICDNFSMCGPLSTVAAVAFLLGLPSHRSPEEPSSLKEFRCEICGTVSENPIHWFVIECTDQRLAVIKWDLAAATSPTARHFCGEAHAQVYISRWFESVCVPSKRVLKAI